MRLRNWMASHCVTEIPSTRTSPWVGISRRLIIFRQVVFPEPLRPSSISVSPRRTDRFTPHSSVLSSETRKVTSANSIALLDGLLMGGVRRCRSSVPEVLLDSPLLCRQTRMPEPVSTRPAPALFHALYFGQLCSSRTLVASVTTTTAARAAPASSAAATAPPSVTAPSATAALATRPVHLRTRFFYNDAAPTE